MTRTEQFIYGLKALCRLHNVALVAEMRAAPERPSLMEPIAQEPVICIIVPGENGGMYKSISANIVR